MRSYQSASLRHTALAIAAIATIATLLILGSCSRSHQVDILVGHGIQSGKQAAFSLNVLKSSIIESGNFYLQVEESAGYAEVTVVAREAVALKAAYFELAYDSSAYRYTGREPGALFSLENEQLALAAEPEPGLVEYGHVLANWPKRQGIDGSGTIATFSFGPAGKARVPRQASSVPSRDQAAHQLVFDPETLEFQWFYMSPGDYDQNGEVGISDLTPLGANFKAVGPFDPSSARFLIDGDGNGEIGIADITTIGANFSANIDTYAVYGSASATDYPPGNTGSNGPGTKQLVSVSFSSALGGGSDRKHWTATTGTPVVGGNYWLRPVADGASGTPSPIVNHNQSWHITELLSYSPMDYYVNWVSYANVAGKPAALISYIELLTTKPTFLYQSATDSLGKSWNSPAPAYTVFATQINPVLAEVDGVPAMAWDDEGSGTLYFGKATDDTGLYWNASTTVVNAATTSHKLIEYDGKPAVCYAGPGGLNVTLANDTEGGCWLTPVSIYPTPSLLWHSMDAAVLPGGIGAVTNNFNDDALVYCYAAIDGTTVTPGTPVTILPGGTGANNSVKIGVAGETPFIMSMRAGYLLYCSYGLDPQGTQWTTLDLAGLDGLGYRHSTAAAYGAPWVCYVDEAADTFYSGYGTDLNGGPWENAPDVIYYPNGIASGLNSFTMGNAGPHPCVAFNQWKEDRVYFAAFY